MVSAITIHVSPFSYQRETLRRTIPIATLSLAGSIPMPPQEARGAKLETAPIVRLPLAFLRFMRSRLYEAARDQSVIDIHCSSVSRNLSRASGTGGHPVAVALGSGAAR